jgi:hypothetical protein
VKIDFKDESKKRGFGPIGPFSWVYGKDHAKPQ